MNLESIRTSLARVLSNQASFSEHVQHISEAGVVKYQVHLLQGLISYCGNDHDEHRENLSRVFDIQALFLKEDIQEAIRTAQKGAPDYSYLGFLAHIAEAGVMSYIVDIKGKNVCYLGQTGETHIEYFPNHQKSQPSFKKEPYVLEKT